MGSIMGKVMEENLKKSQTFMLETQKMQMERQLQMQNMMRERQMAMQVAGSREMFNWLASFYGLAMLAMTAGFAKSKNPSVLVPSLPLTFIVGYQYDWAWGTKVHRIREDAEKLLVEEHGIVAMPSGVPTFKEIDAARNAAKK
ncbi:plasminogen receptor (KT)-like [Anneissia japonica]|uniref:plasminogen receptor (KT)-like n=1 Tax=Anneissia japonica TaxID=1529436 RepID=UPI001425B2D7|nr:plasminogen receptor (KT)-like [Anneissia japonica]XP_033117522.1 plasminogen receptor (KT)-like [Anneissia japonica]XP_033117523.1 plasminogen receptor (KT)-like [Anneissia japonica]